jgi:hypothetical protein
MPTDDPHPPLDADALAELRAAIEEWDHAGTSRSWGVMRELFHVHRHALLRAAEMVAEIERLRAAVDRLVRLYKSEIAEYDAIGSHEIVDSMHRQLAAALAPPSEPAP